ncbi:cellulose biosynthesis cyclic di-GMP-binding regulatory protein BcsB [Legionella fallonii]|uniref:Cyclic di-GMP-binding protein n=1 Tax=Legionella fallonii LLAP-10 TaxID=1212491 RepID=A0A098G0K4_9GAMM|nr:cellulose biosynthesis cyclic di-GMP-binding regulatory protein BcsB [Legionella fallonii]CEG56042.1 putative Cellulose synthase BcsB [Legionella fallonii LLAP-10]
MNLLHSTHSLFLHRLLLLVCSILSFSCAALPFAPNTKNVQASSNEVTNSYTFAQLGWDSSVTLNGYKPNYTFYLPIGTHVNAQKAILHLKMAFSQFVGQETSVEIKFNQTFIRRLTLPSDLSKEGSWDIELPLAQLSSDWQALTFSAYLSSIENLCIPNIWIYISPESSVTLTTLPLPFRGSLNQLPYPFIDPGSINPVPVLLLLPKAFAQQEIFSLLQVAWQLGQLAGDSKVNLSVDFINDSVEKQKENNLILIGTSSHLFKDSGLQIDTLDHSAEVSNALNKDSGILLLSQSPYNTIFGLLTITGTNYAALQKAVSAFLTPEFKSLASGQIAVIDQIQVSTVTNSISDVYRSSFKELGYSDQSVSGLGRHKLIYNIPLPNDRVPNFAQVKTFVTAPKFPGNNNSQITLLVNGLKQSSFWLTQEHSEWQANINSGALKPGINRLDYLIDLHLEHEQCTRENYDEVWATIYSQTQFQASFFNSFPLAMLNQLPVPFNSEVTVVLSEHLSKEHLNNLAKLFFKFGQLFQPSAVHFNFRTSNQVDEDFIRNNNIILIGTPSDNPWVKLALDYMPVQLNRDSRLLKLPQEKLEISGSHFTGLLELIPSPWSEGNAVFLISGDSDSALSWAIKALINDKSRMKLNGNIAIINSDQSTEIFNSYDNRYISLKHRVTMYLSNLGKNILYYLETHPQIFIYLLVLIVPLIIFVRKRNK